MTHRSPQPAERAFAMPVAIVLGIIALVLMLSAATYSMGRISDHNRRQDRVVAMPIVDTAVTRLKFGLEQNLLAEHRNYVPTAAQIDGMLSGSGASKIAGSPIKPGIPPGMPNWTIKEPMANGLAGYWQMLRIFAPDYDNSNDQGVVVVYLRAWTAADRTTGASGSEPRLVRIEFRPGRFADYQAVIDGPIIFGPGADLNGPIHSNGFADERANFADSILGGNERVLTADRAKVGCTGSAQITTAEGSVNARDFPGCPIKTNTGKYVNLLAAEDAFTRIRKACGDGATNVRCFDNTYAGSSIPTAIAQRPPDLRGYRVQLFPDHIDVSGFEINPFTESPGAYAPAGFTRINTPPKSTAVLFFADNVIIDGTTSARVTIAVRKPGEWTTGSQTGAANIYVAGNTESSGAGSVLGLMAQGGVILDAIKRPSGRYACVSRLDASVVAMAGTLTIDPRYTTTLYQAGGPSCGHIEIEGSLAAHRSPVLIWRWDNVSGHAGYSSRRYSWNSNLRQNPPPYFPTTETWEARHVRPANMDCFTGGTITNQEC